VQSHQLNKGALMVTKFSTLKTILLYGVAISGLASAGSALAQTQSPASNSSSGVTADTQEVVVTANKRDERLHDVAMGITAVTGNDLQTRQELDFTEFAAQVPGFNIDSPGVGGWNREILRGQNSGGAGATVATVIDEMPISFSGSDSNAGLTSTNPDTYDLKRVEVLKGPQGTLYGAAAEGGVVKFVTNPPDPTAFHAGAEVGADSVEHGGSGGSGKGYVNVPFWDGKAALRVTGFYEDMPGYIDDPYLNEKDINRTDRYGGRASLLVNPTNDLSVRFTVSHQESHMGGFNEEQVVGTDGVPSTSSSRFNLVDGYTFNTLLPQNDKNEVSYYISDIEYDLHFAKFSSITSYGLIKNTFNRDFSILGVAPGLDYGHYFGSVLFGEPIALGVRQLETLNKFNQEFRLSSEPNSTLFGLRFDWVGGVYLTRENTVFNQFADFYTVPTSTTPGTLLTNPPAGGAHFPSSFDEGALFGQIDYHLTSAIDIAVGGRVGYDVEQLQTTTVCCVIDGSGGLQPKYRHYEQPDTWSVSPRWKITDTTTAYLRFATGYRPGGPNLVPPGAPPGYNYYYQSDSTMNYEGGVRSEFFNHSVTVDLAAFHIDWSNIQILSVFQDANGASYGATGNAGSAESTGLEYNLGWNPIHGLSFALIGAFTAAQLTQDAPGLGAYKNQALAYVPKWSNTIDADYQWPIAEGFKAFVGATAQFVGTRYTDFASSTLGDPHAKLPSYETLSLQGGLKTGPYTFEVYAKNVTDSKGISDYSGVDGYNNTGEASLITPLSVGVRVAVDY
jgi:outer membrane receptor protein involved in Fe transport